MVYIGRYGLTDPVNIREERWQWETNIGKLILSPTRSFAPVLKQILETQFDAVFGLIHCSGGGQTKCLKYLPVGVRVVKNNLFEAPEIFRIIQQSSGADDREMYQVFNMGCRMEIYTDEKNADRMISISKDFGIDARVIGRVEAAEQTSLLIHTAKEEITYFAQ